MNALSGGTSDYERGDEVKLKRTMGRNVSSEKRLKEGNN